MSTVAKPMYEWKNMPWKKFHKRVFKLQKRIYQASQRGDVKTLRKLQRLLKASQAARFIAVRRVTQDNQGKKTAGVDGVKSLTPPQRINLVEQLRGPTPAAPLRRIWIPKPGTEQKRGLAIPTIADRAHQALLQLVLEPAYEAIFENNSYGFRPGRSTQDAIEAIWRVLHGKEKYILDADIAKCFDHINQQALMTKLQASASIRRQIKQWLEAGILDGEEFFPADKGVPQGGPLSPLLMNVALHGLQTAVEETCPERMNIAGKWVYVGKPTLIRYADDLVIIHPLLSVIEQAKQLVDHWLAQMGLELKPSKTRITHSLHKHEQNVGFDFLGFNVRQYPAGKAHSGKTSKGALIGFKTITKPSKKSVERHLKSLKDVVHKNNATEQEVLIKAINQRIKGWCQYFASSSAKETFSKLDNALWLILWQWARRRHPHKTRYWIFKKYWQRDKHGLYFGRKDGPRIYKHSKTTIRRHIKVQGKRSPYDGDWAYWVKRGKLDPRLSTRQNKLLRSQKGRCAYCGLYFKDEDLLEIDHIIPRHEGGKDEYTNWQLLHRHCHDKKTAEDRQRKTAKGGAHDKSQASEEPDEAKVSRPVLQTSRPGDWMT